MTNQQEKQEKGNGKVENRKVANVRRIGDGNGEEVVKLCE